MRSYYDNLQFTLYGVYCIWYCTSWEVYLLIRYTERCGSYFGYADDWEISEDVFFIAPMYIMIDQFMKVKNYLRSIRQYICTILYMHNSFWEFSCKYSFAKYELLATESLEQRLTCRLIIVSCLSRHAD